MFFLSFLYNAEQFKVCELLGVSVAVSKVISGDALNGSLWLPLTQRHRQVTWTECLQCVVVTGKTAVSKTADQSMR